MKPEQLEIAQLKREVATLSAELDILKNAAAYLARNQHEVRLHREAPVIWPAEWLCGALSISRGRFYAWLIWPRSQRSRSDEKLDAKVRASFPAATTAQFATETLVRAIWRGCKPDPLLHHSDCGSQYTSEQFQWLMADQGLVCSMSRSRNVRENAAMETSSRR
jgi:hypothetical protein